MKSQWMAAIMVGVFAVSMAGAQTPSTCPVELSELHVSSLSVHIRNTSSKPIAGMVFNVAFSDATERWKWMHWNYDLTRPLQEFGWNKVVKGGEEKKLGWGIDLEHDHGGGVALVLTSILFADGTRWEDDADHATCQQLWHHKHKKGFSAEVQLPRRE